MHAGLQWRNLKERNHFEDVGIHERVLKWTLNKFDGLAWTGFIWLRVVASGGLW